MLMHELYNILSIFTTGLLLVCGLMFLFAVVPDSPLLSNYRKASYMMAGAYLFFVAVEVVKYLFLDPAGHSVSLLQTVTLTIAAPQALLFTFAMLALLYVRFPGWRYLFREAVYVLLFIVAIITSYALFSGETFRNVFYILIAIYALFLVHYVFLFIKSYRQFSRLMDNYFSDMEAGRLRWVAFSFLASFAVGVTALLSSLFMSTLIAMLFAVAFDIFYTYFAIRFINYAHQFQSIERAMDVDAPEVNALSITYLPGNETAADNGITGMHEDTLTMLEKRIEEWIACKGFTETGITVDTLAARLYTNHKYLSAYINIRKNQTFREWINTLRIEEAKTLLLEHPEMAVYEVARQTGFSDKSHFLRQFKKQINISTSDWKKLAETQDFPVLTPK
jgi:AraC-like DNA-binding protein